MNDLEQSLIRWAQQGLLSPEQAERIRAFELSGLPTSDDFGIGVDADPMQSVVAPPMQAPIKVGVGVQDFAFLGESTARQSGLDSKPDRSAIFLEALGYVGGTLFLIGLGVLLGMQWGEMVPAAHFGIFLLASGITFVAGLGLGKNTVESFRRLGYALWTLSTGFLATAAGLLFGELLDASDTVSSIATTALVSVYAIALYVVRRSALQQLVTFLSIVALSFALLASLDVDIPLFWYGALVVTQGLIWLLLTWAEVIRPKRDGIIQGAGATLISLQAMVFSISDAALILGMALAFLYIVIGVVTSTTSLFIIGAIGLFFFAYESVISWFGSSVLTNAILLLVGAALLGGVVIRVQLKGRS